MPVPENNPPALENIASTIPETNKPFQWRKIVFLGLVLVLFSLIFSSLIGYQSGSQEVSLWSATQIAGSLEEQFTLGLADLDAGRFEIARKRFEYIIEQNPDFPGIIEPYARVLLFQSTTPTATPTLIPPATPTPLLPDLSKADDLFSQAANALHNGDYDKTIELLQSIRKTFPKYKPIEIDGMFYIALKNRGTQRILVGGELESGIWDLTQAERLGPLDTETNSYRDWARWYLTGVSFWEINWGQATYYFSLLYFTAPNLHDQTGIPATKRYATAAETYTNLLLESQQWCAAYDMLTNSPIYADNPSMDDQRVIVNDNCEVEKEKRRSNP